MQCYCTQCGGTVSAEMPEVKAERITHRQRQALETRQAIARAARSLFSERGYATTSIEAVAEEAGVAARTVYVVFGTKKAILGAICEEWLTEAGVMEAVAAGMREPDLGRRLAVLAHSSRRQWESERGGAIIRALTTAEVYSELVAGEGWTPDQYETWLAGLLEEALLQPR